MRTCTRRGSIPTAGFACGLVALALAFGACGESDAEVAFDEFLARADRTPREIVDPDAPGIFADIRGAYLMNIFIRPLGEVYLELRITFTDFEPHTDDDGGATIRGHFTFPDEPGDAAPLAEFESEYHADGTMVVRSGYVRIDPERSPIEDTAVETEFILDVTVISPTEMCGLITDPDSTTVLPLVLQLRGTSFAAQRYGPDGEVPVDVPTQCPFYGDEPDAGLDAGTPDAGDVGDGGVAGDAGLQPPDVVLAGGTRADVTGRFWFHVEIPGLPAALDLLADMTYHAFDDLAALDGSLRVASEPAGPAASVFSVLVDEDGGFTVVIPDLAVTVGPFDIAAELALRAAIMNEDFFCGVGAGSVFEPFPLPLEGTTFGAVRIPAGSVAKPETVSSACPGD